ncbi:mannonate dehydratase [Rhodococcus sp. NPDC055112]
MPIRIALGHIDEHDEQVAQFAHQLGLKSVQFHTPSNLPGEKGYWGVEELAALRADCDRQGLVIEGLENVPLKHFWKIQRGLPGRDEQIENFHTTLRNMAETGYTLLGYNFLPTYVWRTDMDAKGRGGAAVSAFDAAEAHKGNALASYKLTPDVPDERRILDREQMWKNYQYFIDAVLPVAEEVGVRLALHPDDPPVTDALGGVERLFVSPEGIAEAYRRAKGSPAWGLNFCMGTVSEMGGEEAVNEVIDLLAPEGRIFYVHFRDVRGTVPVFEECFLGEGNFDPARVIRRLHDRGFDGFLIDDHVPAMLGDIATWGDTSPQAYCSRGRAYAIGYMQGVLNGLKLDQ